MKSILLSLSLLVFVSVTQAQFCNIQIQGGIDTWPWQVARPFPWDNIQGVWKLNSDPTTFFKMRITGENKKGKILSITKYSSKNCSKPIATGVGFVDANEKNIVRGMMSDKALRYQLTLGFFDTKQLTEISSCDEQVLAASMEVIGQKTPVDCPIDPATYGIELMLLKKVSNSLDYLCRRPSH